jgi:hypothetical protein
LSQGTLIDISCPPGLDVPVSLKNGGKFFCGLDGTGVGTFPGRGAQPSNHCHLDDHARQFVKRIPVDTVEMITKLAGL